MTSLRALIAVLITLSLVVVPASVAASAASIAASGVSDCGKPCPIADQADPMAGMPMSGNCNGIGGKSAPMTPSVCAAFCTGFVAVPVTFTVLVRVVSGKLPRPDVQASLAGRVEPPEPYPPRPAILS